jgi:metal-sulfur cluster biosynthetic enzyme
MAAEDAPPPALDEAFIRNLLRRVMDPEVGMNIVDLGLIYRVEVGAEQIFIEMTMTSPACPMADMILDDIEAALDQALPPTTFVDIRVVWSPPWDPSMMSAEAKSRLGW